MSLIYILNKRDKLSWPKCKAFSVDRSSPIGNPYFMDSELDRDRVCDEYEKYFHTMLNEGANKAFISYVDAIVAAAKEGDVGLACWCYPKRCHAETILRYVEREVTMEKVGEIGNECPIGGDIENSCADCVYSVDYHFENGECLRRN